MLQLINISNDSSDITKLLHSSPDTLPALLARHGLNGVELMHCGPAYEEYFPRSMVQGVHLWFYTNWLDFFLQNEAGLRQEIGDEEAVRYFYGGTVADWLELLRENVRQAVALAPRYVVFHVANVRPNEMYHRRHYYDNAAVIHHTAELARLIFPELPEDITLLYENLWWPGLTLTEPQLAQELLTQTDRQNTGFMLDTGHLMNTNPQLTSQEEGVDYILRVLDRLGPLATKVKGLHLHQSVSGSAMVRLQQEHAQDDPHIMDWSEVYAYVTAIDQHLPFSTPRAKDIIAAVQPDYLVHEFIQQSLEDWEQKISLQQKNIF